MSRINIIDKLYKKKKKSAFEFDFDKLLAPPMMSLLSITDLGDLNYIATSAKYSGRMTKKYKMINEIMNRRGFRKKAAGTNRLCYVYLEYPALMCKVAIDSVGTRDTPAEFRNQNYIKPWVDKIFEVAPNGATGFVEAVHPITSVYEFMSVAEDIFNMLMSNIIGKFVLDDIGTEKFMNYGIRTLANGCQFGPVLLDYPYMYRLDGRKLVCNRKMINPDGLLVPCGGEIDYDAGFNNIRCKKCGKEYSAMDLQQDTENIIIMYADDSNLPPTRSQIVSASKGIILDSGRSSDHYISKEDYEKMNYPLSPGRAYEVDKTIRNKRKSPVQIRHDAYNEIIHKHYDHNIYEERERIMKAERVASERKISEFAMIDETDTVSVSVGYQSEEVDEVIDPYGNVITFKQEENDDAGNVESNISDDDSDNSSHDNKKKINLSGDRTQWVIKPGTSRNNEEPKIDEEYNDEQPEEDTDEPYVYKDPDTEPFNTIVVPDIEEDNPESSVIPHVNDSYKDYQENNQPEEPSITSKIINAMQNRNTSMSYEEIMRGEKENVQQPYDIRNF